MATQTVIVTCDSEGNVTDVSPTKVEVNIGDSIIWQVSGLTEGHNLSFEFNSPELLNVLFESLSPNPLLGGGSEVQGNNFTPADTDPDTIFHYSIVPVDFAGRRGQSFDPQIDSLGSPPGPDDEGGS